MSSSTVAPRRRLSGRSADTVTALVDAAVEEVAVTGYDGLTVRNVARRAGVSPATAYTYFASKDHLLIEVYWRRLSALAEPEFDRQQSVPDRVADTVRRVMLLVAPEPELAAAVTTAMLAHDADVKILRDQIGALLAGLIAHALGDDPDHAMLRSLTMTLVGCILSAGMGNASYQDMPVLMAETATLMTRGGK
jgi:AcrR family transcriptional regulator